MWTLSRRTEPRNQRKPSLPTLYRPASKGGPAQGGDAIPQCIRFIVPSACIDIAVKQKRKHSRHCCNSSLTCISQVEVVMENYKERCEQSPGSKEDQVYLLYIDRPPKEGQPWRGCLAIPWYRPPSEGGPALKGLHGHWEIWLVDSSVLPTDTAMKPWG